MGVALPKPVMTKLLERYGNEIFRCGSCSVNGYRESMEDAHLVYLQDKWGFFGVFDGHVNDQCSAYLEEAWRKVLEGNPLPMSDERMQEIALQIDKRWLDEGREGGSTGTFFLATKEADSVSLQVGNVGDSRVLLCKNGVCKAMTEDHKPNTFEERQRIVDCGGRVENNRVDGSLAVSRAFGDRDYKQGSGDQLQQKVIALPDVTHDTATFNSKDFAVLCCDGVFESNFSNEQVIEFILKEMQTSDDLAQIAANVCVEAINRGSRDNISCVIVEFRNGMDYANIPHLEVVPGPFQAYKNSVFRRVYAAMATKGGLTVEQALERRYDQFTAEDQSKWLPEEVELFGMGPPKELSGAQRTQWFESLFAQLGNSERADPRNEQMQRIQMLQQQVGVPLPILLALMNEGGNDV